MESCAYYLELISLSLDGQLTSQQQDELQQHLEQCPDCRLLARQLSEIHAGWDCLEEQEVPEGFTQGVMDRIRAEAAPAKVIPFRRKRPQLRALASVAACALLCLGLWRMDLIPGARNAGAESVAAAPAAAPAGDIYALADTDAGTAAPAQSIAEFSRTAEQNAPAAAANPIPPAQSTSEAEGDALLQLVETELALTPGILILVDELPRQLQQEPQQAFIEGYSLLVLEETPETALWDSLTDMASLVLDVGDGPIVIALRN